MPLQLQTGTFFVGKVLICFPFYYKLELFVISLDVKLGFVLSSEGVPNIDFYARSGLKKSLYLFSVVQFKFL